MTYFLENAEKCLGNQRVVVQRAFCKFGSPKPSMKRVRAVRPLLGQNNCSVTVKKNSTRIQISVYIFYLLLHGVYIKGQEIVHFSTCAYIKGKL